MLALWGAVYLAGAVFATFEAGRGESRVVAVAAVLFLGWGLALFASAWAFVRGRALPGGRVTGLMLVALAIARVWLGVRTGMFHGGSSIPAVVAGAAMILAGMNQLRPLSIIRWPAE